MSLKWRTRLGMLPPGEVSRGARSKQTMLAWIVLVLTLFMGAAVGMMAWALTIDDNRGSCRCTVQVTSLATNSDGTYIAYSSGGNQYVFLEDPKLPDNAQFIAEFDADGYYQRAIVDGREVQSKSTARRPAARDDTTAGWLMGVVVALMALMLAFTAYLCWQVFHDRRAIARDLASHPIRASGRYRGSLLTRSALFGAAMARTAVARAPGFPVVIELAGNEQWLVAPVREADRVRAFEQSIRGTDQIVDVTYHEHTGVIIELANPAAGTLQLGPEYADDAWNPEVGLPLERRSLRSRARGRT